MSYLARADLNTDDVHFSGADVNVHEHNGETPLHVAMGGNDGKEKSVKRVAPPLDAFLAFFFVFLFYTLFLTL